MNHFIIKLRKILLLNSFYYFLLLLTIIFLILYHFNYNCDKLYSIDDNKFELTIKKYKIYEDKLRIEFKENLIGNYYFYNNYEKEYFYNTYSIGDKVYIEGELNIVDKNTIPNMFNYKNYLKHKNIVYILNIKKINKIKDNKNIFLNIKNLLYKRVQGIKYNSYLYAFILGDSSYIDREVFDNYKINGVTHLFALSGLHVSLFSSLFLSLLKKLKFKELSTFIITSLFLLFFSFIASFTPSILRATIFFILANINKIYYLYIKPKNLLYLTFIILSFINPNYIFNTGFILSFTITFFILLYNEYNNGIKSIIKISFISFLSSLPIIINMNYEINILSFFNNLFFIPFVSFFVFPLSLITIIIPIFSVLLNILTNIMEFVSDISTNILNVSIIFSKMNYFEIVIYYILLILLIKKKKRIKILFLILIIFLYLKPSFDRNDYVYYLDVGQGDSSLIISNNKNILIDTGGKLFGNDLMKSSMILFFKSIGIKKMDYLILTHGDFDHMGESIDLVNNFKVEKVIFNCGEYNDLEKELIEVLNKNKIPYYSCIKELNVDDNKLYFLQTKEYDNENDNSNVIYTELNGYKFMFMGDASITTEKEILDKYNLPDIDVLKVGHHGSKTSSSKEFINKINPKYSVISVGKNNRYGHPNKEVINNLEDSKIYRTDEDGSIMFRVKNNKLKVEKCSP